MGCEIRTGKLTCLRGFATQPRIERESLATLIGHVQPLDIPAALV